MEEARLEGLLTLLTDGCSMPIRAHASDEIARLTTATNLPWLVQKLRPLLRDDEWDTRVAAARTVGSIHALPWVQPVALATCAEIAQRESLLRLEELDVEHLLANAAPLLKSGGEEYDYQVNFDSVASQQAHLALQRRRLWGRLSRSITVDAPPIALQSTRANTDRVVADADLLPSDAMRVIRLAPVTHLFRTDVAADSRANASFASFPLLLLDCLEAIFDARWEVRHGAAHVLRDVFSHARVPSSHAWFDEVLVRGLSVLALEAWVDYASDGSVAPVRELVAQVAAKLLDAAPQHIGHAVPYLRASSWHAAHGGLLALHYCKVALPTEVLDAVVDCLGARSEEEVHSAAAQVLARSEAASSVHRCTHRLWALLEAKQTSLVDVAPGHVLRCLLAHDIRGSASHVYVVLTYLRHSAAFVRTSSVAWLTAAATTPLSPPLVLSIAHWCWFIWLSADESNDSALSDSVSSLWQQLWRAHGKRVDATWGLTLSLWLRTLSHVDVSVWPLPQVAAPINAPITARRVSLATTLVLCTAIGDVLNALPPSMTTCASELQALLESDTGTHVLCGLWVLEKWTCMSAACSALALQSLTQPRTSLYAEQMPDLQKLRKLVIRLHSHFASPVKTEDDASSWTVARVLALAATVSNLPYASLSTPEPYTTAQYLRQDIFALEDKLRTSFETLARRIAAAAASAVFVSRQWSKPGLLVRPWMQSLKEEPSRVVTPVVAMSLAAFASSHASSHAACVTKLVNNLCNSVVAVDPAPTYVVTLGPSTSTAPLDVRVDGARLALSHLVPMVPELLRARIERELVTPPSSDKQLQGLCRLLAVAGRTSPQLRPILCAWATTGSWAADTHALVAAVLATDVHDQVLDAVLQPDSPDAALALIVALAATPTQVVPYLARMVATALRILCNRASREAASVLAQLIPLLALLPSSSSDPSAVFLQQLARGTPPECVLPTLHGLVWRSYQVHGIQWLAFLATHGLHAVLADDMGLGKTLQVLASIAVVMQRRSLRLLIVAPPAILEHWKREARRLFHDPVVVVLTGSSAARRALATPYLKRGEWRDNVIVLTTYTCLQRDMELYQTTSFDYCVADEAHVIRNPTSQTAEALRSVRATHRIAVTGTPLQNTVVDVWSLFEFVLPGYLGLWPEFRQATLLPIQASRKESATNAQKEAGALALTQLHARVQPFILRRTKEHVLTELPPKIIQDVLCDLPEAQKALYDACANRSTHSLQQLSQLQKLCVHPALLHGGDTSIELSGKFLALKDLLETHVGDGHRFLIFCHLQATVDLVADMLSANCAEIGVDRLDGSVPVPQRQAIVDRFNTDASVHALLLTTAVGGLGLTLTGADTVFFLEHSWNPFTDLQAMDRAHRLGQTRTVTVYRLLAKDTVEADVMSCQRFKEAMAAAVVGNPTATSLLAPPPTERPSEPKVKKRAKGLESLLEEIGDLWDEAQYASLAPLDAQP
ncbi:hypothetical protein SDRG_11588 [Saprolegnia diclina VS20]|uniref:TATA-binding protein-associated factor n=1 Tax=Saprolegnia diclina (strain VS20) TaxID=1156394 RepID=T0REW9_SAPDV|nr:hypothetical protein SDRG_11588 [Saprolegnia diclina VS20]EQC30828.1 hypothetical protein SDRG_11588 [Saprolegnia diclina VS20]|eukprot:XP_008615852.1 hypothetical protein SDRG_11588 [Saprolegnia diclina VS20]